MRESMMNNLIKKSLCLSVFAYVGFIGAADASVLGQVQTAPLKTMSLQMVSTEANGTQAQEFIDKMGQRAIGFLSNTSLSHDQKQQEFKKLLESSFDMKTIGRFALGRYWKVATPAQQGEYLKLFQNLIVKVYSSRFNDYKGQGFDVASFRADGSQDFLVNSFIIPEGGSKVKVDWRVRQSNGSYKIIDVIIEGVSMSLTQRSDFASVIQRGGGNVETLLEHLRK